MAATVESMCDSLLLSGIMSSEDVAALKQRWFKPNRTDAQDADKFTKWLVMNQYMTELQASLLAKGQTDSLFLNQYKLLDRIGKGRLAGIYKGTDPEGQTVAIKILPPSKAKDAETLTRFQREARLALKLDHPNVVRTLDAGESNGKYYIVMEYLEGATLEEVLQKKGKLGPVEAARIIGHALMGLQHIHEQQMVHRDLEPQNLMLTSIPAPGQPAGVHTRVVKILDIGLGRALFDEDDPSVPIGGHLTVKGSLLGTLEYTAPEQVRDAHAADIRSDIYSLGAVLYHCLAGRPPYQNVNVLRRGEEPPQPLHELAPDVPEELLQIVYQMMALDPNQRYQTPAAASRAIRVFLNTQEEPSEPAAAAVHADFKDLQNYRAPERRAAVAAFGGEADDGAATPELSKVEMAEAAWEQFRPSDRDIIVFFFGIVVLLVLEGLFALLVSRRLVGSTILVLLGVGIGWAAEKYLQYRREQAEKIQAQ